MSGKLDWGRDFKQRKARENGKESVDGRWQSPGIGKPIRSTPRSDDKVVVVRSGEQATPNLITSETRSVPSQLSRSPSLKVPPSSRALPKTRGRKGKPKAGKLAKVASGPKSETAKKRSKVSALATIVVDRKRDTKRLPQELSWEEFREFHNEKLTVNQLCDALLPVVRRYARDGIRKPPAVAIQLNKDQHKTALGHAWTARLTGFLLTLIFNQPDSAGAITDTQKANRAPATIVTADLIASRLEHLGRIVRVAR